MGGIIIGIILGSVITLAIAHLYYKRSLIHTPEWARPLIEKLPDVQPSREKFIDMIHEFLEEEPIDPHFGIVACPECKNPLDQMKRTSGSDPVRGDFYIGIECPVCGWWTGGEV